VQQITKYDNPGIFFAIFSEMAWNFSIKFCTCIRRFYLRLHAKQKLTDFNNYKVTISLSWPTSDFRAFKNVCANPTMITNNGLAFHHKIFTVNVHCVYPKLQDKPSVTLETHELYARGFHCRLRDKLTLNRLSSTCQNSVALVINRKILMCWKLTWLTTSLAVI